VEVSHIHGWVQQPPLDLMELVICPYISFPLQLQQLLVQEHQVREYQQEPLLTILQIRLQAHLLETLLVPLVREIIQQPLLVRQEHQHLLHNIKVSLNQLQVLQTLLLISHPHSQTPL